MKNKIEDLRNHLFIALEGLADKDNPLDINRAKAISNVANSVIQSAKVEVDYIRATDSLEKMSFLGTKPALESPAKPKLKQIK